MVDDARLIGRSNRLKISSVRDTDMRLQHGVRVLNMVLRVGAKLDGDRDGGTIMQKVMAGITTSLDGYITGPNDGPGRGLGEGGERLHYWVFGGPWTYAQDPKGDATGADKEYLDASFERAGAVIGGRNTYEAAEAWGGQNPFGVPFFIVTHRPRAGSPSSAASMRPWSWHEPRRAATTCPLWEERT
jgi:hypothetical protein